MVSFFFCLVSFGEKVLFLCCCGFLFSCSLPLGHEEQKKNNALSRGILIPLSVEKIQHLQRTFWKKKSLQNSYNAYGRSLQGASLLKKKSLVPSSLTSEVLLFTSNSGAPLEVADYKPLLKNALDIGHDFGFQEKSDSLVPKESLDFFRELFQQLFQCLNLQEPACEEDLFGASYWLYLAFDMKKIPMAMGVYGGSQVAHRRLKIYYVLTEPLKNNTLKLLHQGSFLVHSLEPLSLDNYYNHSTFGHLLSSTMVQESFERLYNILQNFLPQESSPRIS